MHVHEHVHIQAMGVSEETPTELPAEYQRHQRVWLGGLTARSAKVVQVTQSRTANNHRELSVARGEYLEVLDDSKNWWKVVNVLGQVAHVPHTIVKLYAAERDGDEGQHQQHPGPSPPPPPPPDPSLSPGEEGPVSGENRPTSNCRMSKEDPKGDGQINPGFQGDSYVARDTVLPMTDIVDTRVVVGAEDRSSLEDGVATNGRAAGVEGGHHQEEEEEEEDYGILTLLPFYPWLKKRVRSATENLMQSGDHSCHRSKQPGGVSTKVLIHVI
ncbi:uncharacterized protein LOC134763191 [Penaeus indicus]|uniref:uncharacterized protein LOC134763191 n=1 Tax=Penaeus indicus TaxID=29960 RepID=UPI00300CD828